MGDAIANMAHAGGAGKNKKVDVQITLPAGNYKLRTHLMIRTRSTHCCRPFLPLHALVQSPMFESTLTFTVARDDMTVAV